MRRPPGRATGVAACVAAALLAAALAQTATRLLLERSDATIEIVNAGRSDQGARSILDLGGCVPDASVRSNLFYAPEGGVTARIDKEDAETTVVEAPLMIVLRPDGSGDGVEDETIEALDAAATFGRPPCLDEITPADTPRVTLRQGRSTATGERFFLDQGSDVADLDGPVELVREPSGDAPTLRATADALRFDLEAGRSTLTGGVRVDAGERVSEADALELDEEAGVAILTGAPAVSRSGDDEVRGDRLVYDLETNDVVAEGGVSARFEIEGGAD